MGQKKIELGNVSFQTFGSYEPIEGIYMVDFPLYIFEKIWKSVTCQTSTEIITLLIYVGLRN
jgi:hypothetical protein